METTNSETDRDPRLEDFISRLQSALVGVTSNDRSEAVLSDIFLALSSPRPAARPEAQRLPVCAYLDKAIATARARSSPVADVVDAFVALEPRLRWGPRASSGPSASENWPEGHANATIVGRGGLESRDDVQIGVSLLAPHVRYPNHRHGPEEVYLVLSGGRFKHSDSLWVEPGIGGSFHNEPNVLHAMASDAHPLLAIWCLWSGKRDS